MPALRLGVLACFIICLSGEPVFAQWIQANGPHGGQVTSLTVSGTHLFVGTFGGGVFCSPDSGTNWIAANNGLTSISTYILSLAVDGPNLYAGAYGGVFRSTDEGANWSQTGLTNIDIQSLAVVPGAGGAGGILFAGAEVGGVYRSTTNGASWTQVDSGMTGGFVWSLAVAGTNLFAGTQIGGVYRSTNYGASWVEVNNGLTDLGVYALAVGSPDSSGRMLFAGTGDGVFVSTDFGTSWTPAGGGSSPRSIRSFAVMGHAIFAGTSRGGVFISTNNGTSWTSTGLTGSGVCALAVSGTNLYAGTLYDGVFVSPDTGAHWNQVNTGWTSTDVYSILISGADMFAGTVKNGIFRSTDRGAHWTMVNTGLTNFDVYSLAVSGGKLFAGTWGDGVFCSTNNGTTWLPTGLTNKNVITLATSGAYLFAGTENYGVFRSSDNGISWISAGLTGSHVDVFATIGTTLLAGSYGNGVFLSTNYGVSWTAVNNGLYDPNVLGLTVSADGSGNLFAATFGGVALSTNSGANWVAVNNGLTSTTCYSIAASGRNLFTGAYYGYSGGGISSSTNNGASWMNISSGFPSSIVRTFAVSGTNIFAGTRGGGIWRRPLSDFHMYPIAALPDSNGNIFPSDTVAVDSGGFQQFAVVPKPGYHIDSVIVDGVSVDSMLSYTFTHVASNHTIRATFKSYGGSIVPWHFTNTGLNHTIIIDTSAHPSVNGLPLQSGDFIGVFYDSSGTAACAGYEMWTGTGAITVAAFGNELMPPARNGYAAGEVFRWKIFRWAENKIFDVWATYCAPDSLNHLTSTNSYNTNGISKLLTLTGGVQTENLAVRKGWSIVSNYVNPKSSTLDSLFAPIRVDVIILKNNQGKTYIPSVPVNTIGSWNITEGYQLKMNAARILPVTGAPVVPELTPVNLPAGWSIMPYLRQSEMGIETALGTIASKIIIVKDQEGGAYIPSIPVNGIGTLQPGQGYQVKLTGAGTLVYPMNSLLFPKVMPDQRAQNPVPTTVHYRVAMKTDNDATVVFPAKVLNGILSNGDEIGIFDEKGLLVGSGRYEGENLGIAVWGDDPTTTEKDGMKDGEVFTIRYWNTRGAVEHRVRGVEWTQGSSSYEANGISVAGKLESDKTELPIPDHVTLYQNYPNPFNPSTTIKFSIPTGMNVRVRVYNLLGEMVTEAANGNFDAGYHEIQFTPSGLASGLYFYRLEANGSTDVKTMVFMK